MPGFTPSTTAGVKSAPRRSPPPAALLARVAPLPRASAIRSSRYLGLVGSGSGVTLTPSSHGRPGTFFATSTNSFCTNTSATLSCTMTSLMAVQR
eukprot:scaffold5721_cov50-Phaeocystis_antarctica.AAC.4